MEKNTVDSQMKTVKIINFFILISVILTILAICAVFCYAFFSMDIFLLIAYSPIFIYLIFSIIVPLFYIRERFSEKPNFGVVKKWMIVGIVLILLTGAIYTWLLAMAHDSYRMPHPSGTVFFLSFLFIIFSLIMTISVHPRNGIFWSALIIFYGILSVSSAPFFTLLAGPLQKLMIDYKSTPLVVYLQGFPLFILLVISTFPKLKNLLFPKKLAIILFSSTLVLSVGIAYDYLGVFYRLQPKVSPEKLILQGVPGNIAFCAREYLSAIEGLGSLDIYVLGKNQRVPEKIYEDRPGSKQLATYAVSPNGEKLLYATREFFDLWKRSEDISQKSIFYLWDFNQGKTETLFSDAKIGEIVWSKDNKRFAYPNEEVIIYKGKFMSLSRAYCGGWGNDGCSEEVLKSDLKWTIYNLESGELIKDVVTAEIENKANWVNFPYVGSSIQEFPEEIIRGIEGPLSVFTSFDGKFSLENHPGGINAVKLRDLETNQSYIVKDTDAALGWLYNSHNFITAYNGYLWIDDPSGKRARVTDKKFGQYCDQRY